MTRLKLGVIGAGAWGRNHVRTAAGLPDAELAAVCDGDAKVRERVARQYPTAHVTADVADLLGRAGCPSRNEHLGKCCRSPSTRS